eukprot:scaffold24390_cov107-Isochrysis_galbana.AAC.3
MPGRRIVLMLADGRRRRRAPAAGAPLARTALRGEGNADMPTPRMASTRTPTAQKGAELNQPERMCQLPPTRFPTHKPETRLQCLCKE